MAAGTNGLKAGAGDQGPGTGKGPCHAAFRGVREASVGRWLLAASRVRCECAVDKRSLIPDPWSPHYRKTTPIVARQKLIRALSWFRSETSPEDTLFR
jgi:hypothetical protein